MRNQLGVLLEIPSLPRLETNQNKAQKMVHNLELTQETIEVLQLPKNYSKLCEKRIDGDTS